jgi:hypothetical protein
MFLQWCQYLSQDSIPRGHHPGIHLKMPLYVNSNQQLPQEHVVMGAVR